MSSEIIAERITAESSVVVTFIHLRQSLSFMKENSNDKNHLLQRVIDHAKMKV